MIEVRDIENYYRTSYRQIVAYFRINLKYNDDIARELAQDVFCEVLRCRERIQDLESYVWGCAVNRLNTHCRRRDRYPSTTRYHEEMRSLDPWSVERKYKPRG